MAHIVSFYASASDKGVHLSLWPHGAMHVSVTLSEKEARRLARALTDSADDLPRVVEAADLGIEA